MRIQRQMHCQNNYNFNVKYLPNVLIKYILSNTVIRHNGDLLVILLNTKLYILLFKYNIPQSSMSPPTGLAQLYSQ